VTDKDTSSDDVKEAIDYFQKVGRYAGSGANESLNKVKLKYAVWKTF